MDFGIQADDNDANSNDDDDTPRVLQKIPTEDADILIKSMVSKWRQAPPDGRGCRRVFNGMIKLTDRLEASVKAVMDPSDNRSERSSATRSRRT